MLREPKALILPLATFAGSMVVWHICSVQLGWGKAAAEHDPASIWSYTVKLWMIALAVGLPVVAGYGYARGFGWRTTLPWLALAVAVGLVQGFANRGGYQLGLVAATGSQCCRSFPRS